MSNIRVTRCIWIAIVIASVSNYVMTGTTCPPFASLKPCFCSATENNYTIVTCARIRNAKELNSATNSLKSMIIDRFMLFDSFSDSEISAEENDLEPDENPGERLPRHWLSSSRVREIEIQDVKLSNCFLCNDPFDGQDEFLTSLVVTHSSLEGNLCSVCNTKTKSVSTRYLQKMKNLKIVDFSYNSLETVSGMAFPATMEQLEKIILSNNQISRINDNAFANLNHLKELDLSNNKLTTISRKMFRSTDNVLQTLDLSWNSIQKLPEDMFNNLRNLKEVRMSHNLLEVLPENTFARMSILVQKVDVKGNFLMCNCSLSWITRRLSKQTKIAGKCIAPKEVEFHDIKSTLSSIQSC